MLCPQILVIGKKSPGRLSARTWATLLGHERSRSFCYPIVEADDMPHKTAAARQRDAARSLGSARAAAARSLSSGASGAGPVASSAPAPAPAPIRSLRQRAAPAPAPARLQLPPLHGHLPSGHVAGSGLKAARAAAVAKAAAEASAASARSTKESECRVTSAGHVSAALSPPCAAPLIPQPTAAPTRPPASPQGSREGRRHRCAGQTGLWRSRRRARSARLFRSPLPLVRQLRVARRRRTRYGRSPTGRGPPRARMASTGVTPRPTTRPRPSSTGRPVTTATTATTALRRTAPRRAAPRQAACTPAAPGQGARAGGHAGHGGHASQGGHAGGHAGAGVALAASGCPRAPCRRHPNLASATTACWRPTSTPSSPTPTCTRTLSTTLRSPCCCWRTTRASTRGLRSAGCATRRRHSAPTLLCSTRCWRPRGARSLL